MTENDLRLTEERAAHERMCDIKHASIGQQFEDLWARIEDRFNSQDVATSAALAAAEKAVNAALTAQEKATSKAEQLATMRSERDAKAIEALSTLLGEAITRSEYQTAHLLLVQRIDTVSARVDVTEGKGKGASSTVSWSLAGIMTLIAVITIILELTATR